MRNDLVILFDRFRNVLRRGTARARFRYRHRSPLDRYFSYELMRPVAWYSTPADEHESLAGRSLLYRTWCEIEGGHKWLHYFPVYEKIFAGLWDRPVSILEIGVYNGGSMELWRRMFKNLSVFVGLDIDPRCKAFADAERNLFVVTGSQADPALLQRVVAQHGPFDIIIDDGSHMNSHMVASFNHMFPDGLKQGGLYVVEDTHTGYWRSYRDIPWSFSDFAKRCVDLLGVHYAEHGLTDFDFDSKQPVSVPAITAQLAEIRFFDSIVVFEKAREKASPTVRHL